VSSIRFTTAIAICVAFAVALPIGQTADRTIRDQVYSDAQASRGAATYNTKCSECHDGGMGPSLTGNEFLGSWDNKTLRTLYSRILSTMPSDDPGSLTETEVLDLVAYLVRANRFPSGDKALERPDELNTIRIVRDNRN